MCNIGAKKPIKEEFETSKHFLNLSFFKFETIYICIEDSLKQNQPLTETSRPYVL